MQIESAIIVQKTGVAEQGWRSGESTRLPAMWPGFDYRCWCHMWVEFVVGFRPCSEVNIDFSGYSGFPPSKKPTFPNSNSTWKQWMEEPLCGNHWNSHLFIYQYTGTAVNAAVGREVRKGKEGWKWPIVHIWIQKTQYNGQITCITTQRVLIGMLKVAWWKIWNEIKCCHVKLAIWKQLISSIWSVI